MIVLFVKLGEKKVEKIGGAHEFSLLPHQKIISLKWERKEC